MMAAVESYIDNRYENGVDFETWLAGIELGLGRLAAKTTRPYSAAYAQAMPERLQDPRYRGLLEAVHKARPGMTPSEAQRVMLTSVQDLLIGSPGYLSDSYKSPVTWYQAHRRLDSDTALGDRFGFNHFRRPGTTITARGVVHKLVALTLSHRIGERPDVLDLGCGDNSGNRRLLLNENFPYDPLEVIERSADPNAPPIVISDKSLLLNGIHKAAYKPRRITGMDMVDPNKGSAKSWRLACITPEEYLSGGWTDEHYALDMAAVEPGSLEFILGNFSRAGAVNRALKCLGGPVDLASCSVSWYQGEADERWAKFNNAVRAARYTLFTEFAVRNRRNPNYLSPQVNWSALNAFLFDGSSGQMHHLATLDGGRPKRIEIHRAWAELAMGGPYEQQLAALTP